MRYAKLINSRLSYAPNPIRHDAMWYGNPSPEVYLAEGYKPVRYTDQPTPEPGYISVPGWVETEKEIVQTWAAEPEPDEISEERAYRIITGEEE